MFINLIGGQKKTQKKPQVCKGSQKAASVDVGGAGCSVRELQRSQLGSIRG